MAVFLKELDPSLSHRDFRDARRRGAGKLRRLEQCRHRPRGPLRAQLHAGARPTAASISPRRLQVNTEFDLSRQLWTYLIRKKAIASPDLFIHSVPHMSFVHGKAHVDFLKKRHAALTAHHLYRGMDYTEDPRHLERMGPDRHGRAAIVNQDVAATRMITGADVNYGALTRNLIAYLQTLSGFAIHYSHQRHASASRCRRLAHRGARYDERPLGIDASQIRLSRRRRRRAAAAAEIRNSGSLRLCRISRERHLAALRRPDIAKRHHAKVYGMASVGSPPMSVPHLDTRIIGRRVTFCSGPMPASRPNSSSTARCSICSCRSGPAISCR